MSENVRSNKVSNEKKNSNEKRIKMQDLRTVIYDILVSNKLSPEQAEIVTDCYIEADACGVSTHGVSILPAHINKLRSGGYNINPKFEVVREGLAFSVIDSDNSIGVESAVHCMKHAMKMCKKTGIYTVISRNCNTYGPAFYYPSLASKEGLIGFTFCNSPAAMAAWGGKEKLFGTNPFAIVVPCKNEEPIILDMATSKVAKSKINEARIKNEKIPLGWALDNNGKQTTDPIAAIQGLILPMEGYKGYGIALMIDVLAGVLSGAAFLNNVRRFYSEDNKCMNVGQTFIAIDPQQIYGNEFYDLMDNYVVEIRKSSSLDGRSVNIPGDNKIKCRKKSIETGINLQQTTIEKLNQCLCDCGLSSKRIEV